MKLLTTIVLLSLMPGFSKAQQFPYWEVWNKTQADSLRSVWNTTTSDTTRLGTARSLCAYYTEINLDSALYYVQEELALAGKLKQKLWEADALDMMGYLLSNLKDYPGSLQAFLGAMKIAKEPQIEKGIWQVSRFTTKDDSEMARLTVLAFCHLDLARLYGYTGNIPEHNSNLREALRLAQLVEDPSILSNIYSNLGKSFALQGKLDSSLIFLDKSMYYYDVSGFKSYKGGTLSTIGLVYTKKGNYGQAKQYLTNAIEVSRLADNITDLSSTYVLMSDLFNHMTGKDSSLWYAYKGLEYAQQAGSTDLILPAYTALASSYKLLHQTDSAYYYQGLSIALRDSINNLERINQFQHIGFDEQVREQELERERLAYQSKIRTNSLAGGLFTLAIIAFLLYRNNRQKLKANAVLRNTLEDLAATQEQLIQSEKMASLGELTAGIAHEIQNPLNFVNNFSEVNADLSEEIVVAAQTGDLAGVQQLAADIRSNEEKIREHGKRADVIVKSMLQHSRTGSGKKEPTDLNALCDKYLRLAYHASLSGRQGSPSGGKTALADQPESDISLHTAYDPAVGKIDLVPQDIGRVLFNLFNNAFYAVREKAQKEGEGYIPMVTVKTILTKESGNMLSGKYVQVSIGDNGPGIPDHLKHKIFQPFFTTKPTGQGTGLGLSLSYDIITKGHQGTLEVSRSEGGGALFTIRIPRAASAHLT
jgi:signal transduction histidine kinase